MRAFVAIIFLIAACAAPAPTTEPAVPAGANPPAAAQAPRSQSEALAQVRALIDAGAAGAEKEDLLSLLRAAEGVGDQGQRYQAFLGAWQFMRIYYLQNGRTEQQKAALDALEAVARTFPQYEVGHFAIERKP